MGLALPKGSCLTLTIQGKDFERAGATGPLRGVAWFTHDDSTDRPPELFAGTNTLHTGDFAAHVAHAIDNGAGEQARRDFDADDLAVTRLMTSLEPRRLLHREVGRLRFARELVAPGYLQAARTPARGCPTKYSSVGRRFWKLQAPSTLLLSRSQQYGQHGTGRYP